MRTRVGAGNRSHRDLLIKGHDLDRAEMRWDRDSPRPVIDTIHLFATELMRLEFRNGS